MSKADEFCEDLKKKMKDEHTEPMFAVHYNSLGIQLFGMKGKTLTEVRKILLAAYEETCKHELAEKYGKENAKVIDISKLKPLD